MNKGKWGVDEWLMHWKKELNTAKRELKDPAKFNYLMSLLSKLAEDNIKPWKGTTGIGLSWGGGGLHRSDDYEGTSSKGINLSELKSGPIEYCKECLKEFKYCECSPKIKE